MKGNCQHPPAAVELPAPGLGPSELRGRVRDCLSWICPKGTPVGRPDSYAYSPQWGTHNGPPGKERPLGAGGATRDIHFCFLCAFKASSVPARTFLGVLPCGHWLEAISWLRLNILMDTHLNLIHTTCPEKLSPLPNTHTEGAVRI